MNGTTTLPDTAAEAKAASFAPNELAALRERQEAVKSEWVAAVRSEIQAAEGDVGLVAEVSGETQEQVLRLAAEYDFVSGLIRREEDAKAAAGLVAADEDLTRKAPNYRDRQARIEAKWYDDFLEIGKGPKGRYSNASPNAASLETAGTLSMGQPLIARNPVSGKNEVYPVAAIFAGEGPRRQASVEASMRQMAIIAEDKFGKYDPISGNRVGHRAPVGREVVTADLGKGRRVGRSR